MDWKSLYSNAFPKKQAFAPYTWPKLEKAGPGEAGSYPALQKPGPAEASSYPKLIKPGPGEKSSYPQLKKDTSSPSGGATPTERKFDHVGLFGFRVEIEGLNVGAFTKVEGLNVSIESIEYQHSNDITPRKRMGRIKVDNVKLIKGYRSSPDLYEWCLSAMDGDIKRRAISIILLDDARSKEPIRYNLFECWPCKWSGFRLDAGTSSALVEEIELVVEELEVA
jgi:phage tail-like protein